MLFSSKEITKLLADAVENDQLDIEALSQILYFLHLSNEEIPLIIAEKIIREPELISNQDILGKRLAFTHVKELSEIRNFELRNSKQVKISRQLNRIALFLEEHKAPASILFDFTKLCHSFLSTLIFFESRKQNLPTHFAAEEVLVIEQLLESILNSKDLSLRFYENLFQKLGTPKAQELAMSLLKRLSEALTYENGENVTESIINPNETLHISKSLETSAGFQDAVGQLNQFLEKKLGKKASLH